MFRPALIGFFSGILFDVIIWFSGPLNYDSWFTDCILFISTPAAYVVSWFTGWPMQQEAAIFHYVIGMLVTFPLLGLLIGIAYRITKKYRQRKSAASI